LEPEVAFGQVLRGLRKRQGLSQEKLAQEAGVERNYVSLLELGRNSASIKTVANGFASPLLPEHSGIES
jgi:transcriptional regulator with XRE-family HTH domain